MGSDSKAVKPMVGYIRVSTTEQATDGYGLDAQRAGIERYCRDAGIPLAGIYADEGMSGTLPARKRPGLWRAITDVEGNPELGGIVVNSLDRIGRSVEVASSVFGVLRRAEATVASATEGVVPPMVQNMYATMAEAEKEAILERTRGGRLAKARQGGYAGGRVTYGYRLEGYRRDSRLVVDEDRAAVVRRIFAERAGGATLQQIADRLTSDGVPTPGGAAKWSTRAVYTILSNRAYTGTRVYREQHEEIIAEAAMPAIVSEETFQACQPKEHGVAS